MVYNVPQKRTGLGGISTDDKKRVLAVPVSLLRTGGMYVEKERLFSLIVIHQSLISILEVHVPGENGLYRFK